MTNEGPRSIKFENPDDQETVLFRNFIEENNYTADQMREAYYRLVGVEEGGEPTPEVAAILSKMQEMVTKDFPLNRFATVIEENQDYEEAVPAYHKYVDSLEISDTEKEVLRSIIDKERSGEVVCMIEGETIGDFKIKVKDFEKEIAAMIITKSIERLLLEVPKGERYAFNFTEL